MAVLSHTVNTVEYVITTQKCNVKQIACFIGEEMIGTVNRLGVTDYRNSAGLLFSTQVEAIRNLASLHVALQVLKFL